MRASNSQRWGRGAWVGLLAVTAVAAGGCAKQAAPAAQQASVQQVGPRPTPAPNFPKTVDSIPHSDLLAYAHGLQFDSTLPGADAQYLVLRRGRGLALGPFLEVAPEIGAAAITRQQLVQGRILARVKVSAPVPGLGLLSGVSYVWIDSTGGAFRALIVPEGLNAPVAHVPIGVDPYKSPGADLTVAIARIVTTEAGGFRLINYACPRSTCDSPPNTADSLHRAAP